MNGAEDGYVDESKESSEEGISRMMDDPKPPGVTVRIVRWSDVDGLYWYAWSATLDGVHNGQFEIEGVSDEHDDPFPTPEAAEADCRKKLHLLVERLLPALTTGRAAFTTKLNINFVRE